jgi:hypothetical protein
MNKSSPEYIRVRNEIAKMLCDKDNPILSEPPNYEQPNSFWDKQASEVYKQIYRNVADSILAIKGLAILADDQSLPDYPANNLGNYSTDEVDNKCLTTQIKMQEAGFKNVVE